MKNIEASVGAVPTQGKKEEEAKVEEDEYTEHRNEMYFFLEEHPEYRVFATGRWLENHKGEVVGDADTYFRHVLTGERCETAWTARIGWSDQDEKIEEYGKLSLCAFKILMVSNKLSATRKVLRYKKNAKKLKK